MDDPKRGGYPSTQNILEQTNEGPFQMWQVQENVSDLCATTHSGSVRFTTIFNSTLVKHQRDEYSF